MITIEDRYELEFAHNKWVLRDLKATGTGNTGRTSTHSTLFAALTSVIEKENQSIDAGSLEEGIKAIREAGDRVYDSINRLMTPKANGITYRAYTAAGWTDAQLIEHGYMEIR